MHDVLTFHGRLKHLMHARGLRQIDVARATGLSQALMHKLMTGKTCGASARTLVKICRLLQCDAGWLCEGVALWPFTHPASLAEPTAQTDHLSPSAASNSPQRHTDAPPASSEATLELLWLLMRTPRRYLPADSMMRALSRAVSMHGPAALKASEDRVRVILARLRAQLESAGQILVLPAAGAPNAKCGSTAPTPHAHAEAPAQPAPPAPHQERLQVLPKSSAQPSSPDPHAATGF